MKYIGVDGCKLGWFYVSLDDESGWNIGVVKEINELLPQIRLSKITLIDIPIGLRECDKSERLCDLSARKVIGKRRSSVFPVPCRSAIYCTSYEQASHTNYLNTGRKLSKQSWAIAKKIKEVDIFLRENAHIHNVREIHPEVCFWALNKKNEMAHSKKEKEGFKQRAKVLSGYCPQYKDIIDKSSKRYLRKEVAWDDILDAMVGAVVAKNSKDLETLPTKPEVDAEGIKMEVVF